MHSLHRIAIRTAQIPHRMSTSIPIRIVAKRSTHTANVRAITSTIHHFTKAAMGSCNNVNKLGAMSLQKFNTRRATITCSKLTIDGYRTKRVSVNHFGVRSIRCLALSIKRRASLLRSTELCTSTKILSVQAGGPLRGHSSILFTFQTRLGNNSFNVIGPSIG